MSDSPQKVDAAIVAIVARELIEAALFIVDFFGVVLKSEDLSRKQKQRYCKYLTAAVILGFLCGAAISLGVGFGVAAAVDQPDNIELGITIGEAVSRTIASWFVVRLTFKIPTWFGISRYVDPDLPDQRQLSAPLSFATSLWWNTWREATEGGCFTALVAIFDQSLAALGLSVGIGVAVGVGLGGALALGGRFVSRTVFGIIAVVIAALLAIGLLTGAVRAWEEVYELSSKKDGTPSIYETEGNTAAILQAFEFCGVSDNFTVLTLTIFILSIVWITFLLFWHHYFGLPLIPRKWKLAGRRLKASFTRRLLRCCPSCCQRSDAEAIDNLDVSKEEDSQGKGVSSDAIGDPLDQSDLDLAMPMETVLDEKTSPCPSPDLENARFQFRYTSPQRDEDVDSNDATVGPPRGMMYF